jgi:tellurite resistance protein
MINHHAALIYTMVIMAAADRDVSDAELGAMTEMVGHLPVFRDYDKSMISKTSASCGELLKSEDGLDKILKLIRAGLPEKLRETAYALACDVVAADQTVTREEARLLDLLRYELQIGKLVAAAIERGARARHLTAS